MVMGVSVSGKIVCNCLAKVEGHVNSFRFVHSNGRFPTKVTESGIVILVSFLHPENAPSPMEVTESGIIILVRLSHPSNACSPMEVTDSGMVILVSFLHPLNASPPIEVIILGISTFAALPS